LGLVAAGIAITVEVVECGDECNALDAISVNNWVTTTLNQEENQWQPGDDFTVIDSMSRSAWYQYSPLFGRFVLGIPVCSTFIVCDPNLPRDPT
ncbi:MAG: hypothetical protein AAGF72_19020, partial [Pseudomonadota bacterium]